MTDNHGGWLTARPIHGVSLTGHNTMIMVGNFQSIAGPALGVRIGERGCTAWTLMTHSATLYLNVVSSGLGNCDAHEIPAFSLAGEVVAIVCQRRAERVEIWISRSPDAVLLDDDGINLLLRALTESIRELLKERGSL